MAIYDEFGRPVGVGEAGPAGSNGADGADGEGVPVGGTTGQVLAKASATDFDTEWVTPSGGGGGGMDDFDISDGTTSQTVGNGQAVTVNETNTRTGPLTGDLSVEATRTIRLTLAATDPGADRILGYDDSATGLAYFVATGGLEVAGTDLRIADAGVTNSKLADMAQSTIKGRAAGAGTGAPQDLSASQVRTILNVADGANAYTHPNHSGDVTSVGDGAQTIASNAVTYAKIQQVSATNQLLGRGSPGAGNVEELGAADVRSIINVADGANNYSHPNHSGDVASVGDGATTIATNAVTTAKIADLNITAGKLAANAVETAKLLDGAVTTAKINNLAVDANKLAADSVVTTKLINGAVTNAKMANMVQATIKGRASGAGTGAPVDLTATQVRTIINVADGANAYVHPNHSGDVTSVGDGAQTIATQAVTYAKMQNVSAHAALARVAGTAGSLSEVVLSAETLLGRGATGNIAPITLGTNLSMSGTTLNAAGGGGGSPGGSSGEMQWNNGGAFAGTTDINRITGGIEFVGGQFAQWQQGIDAHPWLRINGGATARRIELGSGAAAPDTTLYRDAAGYVFAKEVVGGAESVCVGTTPVGAPYDSHFTVTPRDGLILVNTADDTLRFRSGGTWHSAGGGGGGGGMDDFLLAGDSGTPQTISDGNTLTVAGGRGIVTEASATDTVTVRSIGAVVKEVVLAGSAITGGTSEVLIATATIDAGRMNVLRKAWRIKAQVACTFTANQGLITRLYYWDGTTETEINAGSSITGSNAGMWTWAIEAMVLTQATGATGRITGFLKVEAMLGTTVRFGGTGTDATGNTHDLTTAGEFRLKMTPANSNISVQLVSMVVEELN